MIKMHQITKDNLKIDYLQFGQEFTAEWDDMMSLKHFRVLTTEERSIIMEELKYLRSDNHWWNVGNKYKMSDELVEEIFKDE